MPEISKTTISVSMIVKNEEIMLPKCLKSIAGVDEIVIVDTGSTDRTIEIAKEAGAKVYTEYKWADNFAEARNVSKAQCTGDWVLIIDADEILDSPVVVIRELLAGKFMEKNDGVMFKVQTAKETNDQVRMFRNLPEIQWVGAAHNLPYIIDAGKPRRMDLHYSTLKITSNFSPSHKADPDRTLRIMTNELRKGVAAIGAPQYTRFMYYTAREWLNRREPMKTLFYLLDYVKIAPPTNELADAWYIIASCYTDLGKLEEAVDACLQTIKYQPEFKAAYALLHNLAHPSVKHKWEKMFHMANNEGVLFTRREAEKLYKPNKK